LNTNRLYIKFSDVYKKKFEIEKKNKAKKKEEERKAKE
jgi:hypothetical protein